MKFVLFGIIQGLTEFFPVSSSGHLYFLKKLLGVQKDCFSFFVFLHIATLLAILFFLSKSIRLLRNKKLLLHIVFITFITGIFGLGIRFYLKSFFDNKYFLTLCFLINGGMLLSMKDNSNGRTLESIKLKDSLFIGILQGISPLPGISRSGITIIGLLRRGFAKEEAFILSFLMAIPVILGAFTIELKELTVSSFLGPNMIIGFVFAFFSGLFALKIVKRTLIMEKFKNFGYYCLFISLMNLIV